MKISTQSEFLELASQGLCGNTPRTFLHLADAYLFALENRGSEFFASSKRLDGFRIFHVNKTGIEAMTKMQTALGFIPHPTRPVVCDLNNMYFMLCPPSHIQSAIPVFQGEYMSDARYLYYADQSTVPWGAAKRSGIVRHLEGLRAVEYLKARLRQEYDELEELGAKYPGCTIEFTLFPQKVTRSITQFGKPLLIWEVRHY